MTPPSAQLPATAPDPDQARRPGSTVVLRFAALPEHVRTARLVAAAVARRAGVTPGLLDEVRVAVGEACTLAVARCRVTTDDAAAEWTEPIVLDFWDTRDALFVRISDSGTPEDHADDDVSLALVSGLADGVQHSADAGVVGTGEAITLSWWLHDAASRTEVVDAGHPRP